MTCLVANGQAFAGEPPSRRGLDKLHRLAVPVSPVAVEVRKSAFDPEDPLAPSQTCGFGDAQVCYTPVPAPASGRFLNVASFFDRGQRSTTDHFLVKYIDPGSAGRLRVRGLGFHATASPSSFNRLQAAGVVITSASDPVFPSPEDLRLLSRVNIQGEDPATETCVAFTSEFILEPGEAAFAVLRFPDVPDSTFVGILVDEDGQDEDCDFMTPDFGEHWYRPDPAHAPFFDWVITLYTEPLAAKNDPPPADSEPTWTTVKKVYR